MSTEQNQDGVVDENNEGEGTEGEVVTLKREEYAKLNETLGSLKRDLKDLKKEKEETPEKTKPDEALLKRLDNLALKTSGISEADERELFEKWKTETGREADAIIDNSIFKKELEDLRTAKANLKATSDIKGEGGEGSVARNTPEYWIAKATKGTDGKLMFPEETPPALFSKIVTKMGEKEPGRSQKLQFYNQ